MRKIKMFFLRIKWFLDSIRPKTICFFMGHKLRSADNRDYDSKGNIVHGKWTIEYCYRCTGKHRLVNKGMSEEEFNKLKHDFPLI